MNSGANSLNAAHRRVIGITGGIGMGKTTISDYLANTYGLPVLDADCYAREAVEPGTAVLAAIVDRYGAGVLRPNGVLDRARLGNLVFNMPSERIWLEQQIHPFVRDRLETQLQALQSHPVVAVVIPLLFEARMTDLVSEIWVVRSDLAQQVQRLQQRDGLDLNQIQVRISSQMPIEQKIERADVVLDNTSTVEALLQQVDLALHQPLPFSKSQARNP